MPAIVTYTVTEVRTYTVHTSEGVEDAIAQGAKAFKGDPPRVGLDEVQVQSLSAERRS